MHRYDETTALIVVDVQNDFADPAGSLHVPGGAAIIGHVNREMEQATAAGALVVLTQDWHPPSTPHFAKDGGVWPVHCVADTWGAELHPELVAPDDAPRVRKGTDGGDGYSGFTTRDSAGVEHPTELEGMLREESIERVVVVGLATDYCVKGTALDAARLGFDTFLVTDAIAAVEVKDGDSERAIEEMNDAGVGLWGMVAR
jgi:nicotinamidase/pyrazinamidase